MKNRFFNPFVGSNYTKGIRGKRVLVVGASFYCDQHACPYFKHCTDVDRTENYVCHLQVPGVDHPIAVINPYHPSATAWYSHMSDFDKYFTALLEEKP